MILWQHLSLNSEKELTPVWVVSDFGVGINLRPLLRTFICESVNMLLRLTTKFGSDLVCLIWLCKILWYLFLFRILAFLLFVLSCLRVCLRVLSFVGFLVLSCDISSEKR